MGLEHLHSQPEMKARQPRIRSERGKQRRREWKRPRTDLGQPLLQPLNLPTHLLPPLFLLLLTLSHLLQRPCDLRDKTPDLIALLFELGFQLGRCGVEIGEGGGEGGELGVERGGGLGEDGCGWREEVGEEIFLRMCKGAMGEGRVRRWE